MEKILVPTDYSKEAHHALLFAMDIAQRTEVQIILFHAFNQSISTADNDDLEEAINALEKEETRLLEKYAEEIKDHLSQNLTLPFHNTLLTETKEKGFIKLSEIELYPKASKSATEKSGVNISCICKFGLAAEAILVATEGYGVDLIIMGMRGAGSVTQAFWGSTVANVIQTSKVPVLALPIGAKIKNFPIFVFAIDLPAIPHHTVLSWLRVWVKLFQAHLKVLHVFQDNNPQQEQQKKTVALEILDTELNDIAFEVYFSRREEIIRGIQEFIQNQQVDLLAVVPKPHDFLEILFQDTITGYMIEQSLIPLLTIPDNSATE